MFRYAIMLAALACSAAAADEVRIVGQAEIVDGDTLSIGPIRIRLNGIDAPEAGQTCKRGNGQSWQCGTAATSHLAEMVEGRQVECAALDADRYGRIIATCSADGIDVNRAMVDAGLAWAFIEYADDHAEAEKIARDAGVGVWQGEAETPWEYRANRWKRAADASPRPGCPIKGNVSRGEERIYHTPWSPWYDRTQIDEADGERWFCDEAEAIAAGWRPARWR